MLTLANFINSAFTPPISASYLDVVEPATGQVFARTPDSRAEDVNAAVAAAKAAFPDWSLTPAAERSRLLLRLADLIDHNLERLARAESQDNGKPVSLAREVDIPRSAANFRFFATAILHNESALHDSDGSALNYTLRAPRGAAALISPWNLPLYLLTWKIAPALATGNTAVAKPSEVTPLTAHLLAELSQEAGLPPGVLNIVHGTGPHAGAALIAHPDVPTISFTGGTATGRAIAATAAPMFKRLSLELGGKNPGIIFADADLPSAIDSAVRSSFRNQGEICLCAPRLLVQRSVFDRVLAELVARAKSLRSGDPSDPDTEQGALVSATHLAKVHSYVTLARELGGTVHCGGEPLDPKTLPSRCKGGFFFPPTVITGLDPRCRVEQEEIFGPVVTLTPFDTDDDALALANSTPYGLAATLWTQNLARAHRMAARLETGIVWINCWMLRDLRTPFGGVKQSGVGREGGLEALRFFTEPRNICVKL